MLNLKPVWEEESDVLTMEDTDKQKAIVLYNDNHNSFDHVIRCLVKYCKHDYHQAGQCAFIIHAKGKYAVKHGTLEELEPICAALQENGLDAKIRN